MSNRVLLSALVGIVVAVGVVVWKVAGVPAPAAPLAVESHAVAIHDRFASAELSAPASSAKSSTAPTGPTTIAETAERTAASSAYEQELAAGHWVEGRVVFPPGTPLDEEVFVRAQGRKLEHGDAHRVRVDANGNFRVAFAERTRKGELELDARYVYLEERPRFDVRDAERQVLEPRLGGRLQGRIVLPEDSPVAAEVLVGKSLSLVSMDVEGQDLQRTAEIGEDLTYALGGLPAARVYAVWFTPEELEHVWSPDVRIDAGATTSLDLEPGVGVSLVGRVVDEIGAPLAEVDVHARSKASSGQHAGFQRNAQSDGDGTFRIRGVQPGEVVLEVTKKGFVEQEVDLGVLEDRHVRTGLEIVLPSGFAIAGRVTWSDGSPAEDAHVSVQEPSKRWNDSMTWRTDAEGRFRVSGLEDAEYSVLATASRTEEMLVTSTITGRERTRKHRTALRATQRGVEVGTEDLELVLGSGLVLRGSVIDDLGAPIERFRILAVRSSARPSWGGVRRDHLNGSFRDMDGSFELAGFDEGEWVVQANATGYGDSEELTLSAPADLDGVVLQCGRDATVLGVVRAPNGIAVPEATVWLKTGRTEQLFPSYADRRTRTDANGAFQFDNVSPVSITLHAEASGAAPSEALPLDLEPGQRVEGLEIELRSGGRITVEVAGARADRRRIEVRTDGTRVEARTDESGLATFDDLLPGSYFITAHPSTAEVVALAGAENDSAEQVLKRYAKVELAAGDSRQVLLEPNDVSPIHVSGRVVAGAPFGHGNVSAYAQATNSEGSARIDPEGRYDLYVPVPGDYELDVRSWESGMNYQTSLIVPDVEHFEFDVRVPVGSLAGRVRDPDGQPVAGIHVLAQDSSTNNHWEGSSGYAQTGEDGAYEIEVPAGTYDVRAGGIRSKVWDRTPSPYGEAQVENVVVAGGSRVRGIDLHLPEPGTLRGTVRTATGQPVEAILNIYDARGEALPSWGVGRSDASGRFEVPSLAPGSISVRASTFESTSSFARVDLRAGEEAEVELVLEQTGGLSVHVPGAGDRALVTLQDEAGRIHVPARAEDAPRWNFRPLPAGVYAVTAVDGARRAAASVDVGSAETAEVALDLE